MLPVVAIVGRPNVGKSTLFNRLCGSRRAIVEDFPGVTRDRNYAEVTRHEKPFMLIDTGGFEPASRDRLLTQMREQSQLAIEEADVIIFLMDGREGLNASDTDVVAILRQVKKPVLYVANKIDGGGLEPALGEFYSLGVAEVLPASAEHGYGINDLIDELMKLLPAPEVIDEDERETRIAVIGRPNVGKSSLVNRMLGYERVVANPTAGTTRDTIDTPFQHHSKRYVLIDTAGIRRKGKVSQKLEKFSVIQALKGMERAHITLVLIDASEGVTDQDVTVAGYAHEKGRAIILLVNKWDLVAKDNSSMKKYTEDLRIKFKFLAHVPILFISATTGQRVAKIMDLVESVAEEFNRKISTPELNRILKEAEDAHPPAFFQGQRVKFYYATQSAVRPPTFIIFANRAKGVHFSYERYLVNKFREAFGFDGVPIRLIFRDRERNK